MKFIASLAFKNLTRYTRRTIITAVAIAAGLGLYIMTDGLLVGIAQQSDRNVIWYETGSARVQHKEFQDKDNLLTLGNNITNPAAVLSALEAEGYKATPRIDFTGEILVYKDPYKEDGSLPTKLTGVDPERDSEVYRLEGAIKEGRFFENGSYEAVIGRLMANNLGAEVGYPLRILTNTMDGYSQTIDLTIVGIAESSDPIVDRATVYLPLNVADEALEMGGAVTSVSIHYNERLDQDEEAAMIQDKLTARIPGAMTDLDTVSWRILAKDYLALASAKEGGSGIIMLLIFAIAAVGITNTMLMAIYERMYEIAMMRAMGMKKSEIYISFILEAFGIGLIGSFFGLILGALMTWPMVHWGIDYSFITDQMDVGYRVTGVMRAAWNPKAFFTAFNTGIFLSVAMALIPTRKALKRTIVSGLREGGNR